MNWASLRRADLRIASAAREALRAVAHRGPARRRAAVLCELGDQLSRVRPRDWAHRARRAYQGAIRRLDDGAAPGVMGAAPDAATVAHALLREARRPFRRFAAVLMRVTALAAVGVAATVLITSAASTRARAWWFPPDLGATATWTASSTHPASKQSGRGTRSDEPLFFHTESQDRPWLQITLARVAKVRRIEIENRADCCEERALPLNVEVPDGNDWRLICQRRAPFSTWTCRPGPTTTQVIRIELPEHTSLHLKRVSVFE